MRRDEGLPARIAPMLATARPLPASGQGYGWEWKHDGFRLGARVAPGQGRLDSRNDRDFTTTFPEIADALVSALPGRRVSLDGEVIAPDPGTGVADFGRLQQRLGAHPSARLLARVPVTYVLFDVVFCDGVDLGPVPYRLRREVLDALHISHPRLVVPPHMPDADPRALLEIARDKGLEGIVGKELDSTYRPGRAATWIKHALRRRVSLSIGGWVPGKGQRAPSLGALLLGRPSTGDGGSAPGLEFVGAVGTGWSALTARGLLGQLTPLAVDASPFSTAVPAEYARHARWVSPQLVADVDIRDWSSGGYLRHPSFKGLRADLSAGELN
jgi:bifunctional non-homologous end joining protein LigD